MFSFHASWDPREYVRADRATRRYRLTGRWRNWLPWLAALIVGVMALSTFLFLADPKEWMGGDQAVWLLLFFVGLPVLRFVSPFLKARALGKSDPDLAGGYERVIDEQGLRMAGKTSSVAVSWERLLQVRETPEFFLFYFHPAAAYYLPKRAIPNGTVLESLRGDLRQRLGDRAVLS